MLACRASLSLKPCCQLKMSQRRMFLSSRRPSSLLFPTIHALLSICDCTLGFSAGISSQLKDHLTFIPAFAVEATVKQSFALALVCKTNQDPSLRQSFPHSRLKLICRSSLRSPSKVSTLLCESMTWEYAQEWPPLNIREAENIVTPAQLMTIHDKLFLKDMSFSFVCTHNHTSHHYDS